MTPSDGKARPKRKAPPHAWKPGQSGNPGGKKPMTEAQRAAREARAAYSPEAVEVLRNAMLEAPEWKDRIHAAKAMLEGLEPVKFEGALSVTAISAAVERLDEDVLIQCLESITQTKELPSVSNENTAQPNSAATVDSEIVSE